jgi:hypothetical protein
MTFEKVSQVLETTGQAESGCQQMIREVQAELVAFHAAVRQLYGEAAALTAADLWLEEFTSSDTGQIPCWRSITVAAASRLAQTLGFAPMERSLLMSGVAPTASVLSVTKEAATASQA